jgi:hypothetical protein
VRNKERNKEKEEEKKRGGREGGWNSVLILEPKPQLQKLNTQWVSLTADEMQLRISDLKYKVRRMKMKTLNDEKYKSKGSETSRI